MTSTLPPFIITIIKMPSPIETILCDNEWLKNIEKRRTRKKNTTDTTDEMMERKGFIARKCLFAAFIYY